MRYKGNYKGSELLCLETKRWVKLADCVSRLEQGGQRLLADDITVEEKEEETASWRVWQEGSIRPPTKEELDQLSHFQSQSGPFAQEITFVF